MTDDLLGAGAVRELLARHDVRPQKSLGQNFVIDPNTIRKVLSCAKVDGGDDVLEIGAGAGSLTLGLSNLARSVTALEFDRRLVPLLEEVLGDRDNVTLLEGDALEFDLSGIKANKLVANLPYNIATPVVMKVLETAPQISKAAVMSQKEVGERLVAGPGGKVYGAPSVLVAYFASARIAARISRRAFWPVPGVDSVVVSLARREETPDVDYASFAAVVRGAFSQRRKTARNALADVAGSPRKAEDALTASGLEPSTRPEEMSLDNYVDVALYLSR